MFAAITWSGSRTAYNAAPLGPSSRRRKTSPYTIPCGRLAAALSRSTQILSGGGFQPTPRTRVCGNASDGFMPVHEPLLARGERQVTTAVVVDDGNLRDLRSLEGTNYIEHHQVRPAGIQLDPDRSNRILRGNWSRAVDPRHPADKDNVGISSGSRRWDGSEAAACGGQGWSPQVGEHDQRGDRCGSGVNRARQ